MECWSSWYRKRTNRRNINEYARKSRRGHCAGSSSGGGGSVVPVAVQQSRAAQAHRARHGAALQRTAATRKAAGDRQQPGGKEEARGRSQAVVVGRQTSGVRRLRRSPRRPDADVVST